MPRESNLQKYKFLKYKIERETSLANLTPDYPLPPLRLAPSLTITTMSSAHRRLSEKILDQYT
jgi:hypothetical protein